MFCAKTVHVLKKTRLTSCVSLMKTHMMRCQTQPSQNDLKGVVWLFLSSYY